MSFYDAAFAGKPTASGEVFDPNDLSAMGRAVDRLVSDPHRVQQCKNNAFRYAGDVYNWEVQSKPYLEAIDRFFHDDATILKYPKSTTQRRERKATGGHMTREGSAHRLRKMLVSSLSRPPV